MDFSSLKDQVSNLTMYDLKAGVRKVQNGETPSGWCRNISRFWIDAYEHCTAVMNYTEMEAKVGLPAIKTSLLSLIRRQVREATNNEPWGASSTLMQEIANATHS